jgi:hypothetical protein
MRLRIADCGLRISNERSARVPTFHATIRNPKSAIRNLVLLLAACTPVTTRPDFKPDPRALVVILNARPERVTVGLDSLLPADSLEVARFNVRDGYVESAWYDPARRRSYRHERDIADLPGTVKIRCWADPWVPGQTRLTIEPVYRPRVDPSRSERDLEVIAPPEHGGYKVAQQLIEQVKQKFGTPQSAQ